MAGPNRLTYDPQKDYYDILGVNANADAETIQRAFRQKAKSVHPDLNPDREEWAKSQFQLVNEAYRILNNVESRQAYNNLRRRHLSFAAPNSDSSGANPAYQPHQAYNPYAEAPSPQADWYASQRAHQRFYQPQQVPGQWLTDYGLGIFQPAYRSMVRLLGSPYRYLLFFVAAFALLNSVFIVAGFIFTMDNLIRNEIPLVASQTAQALTTPTASTNRPSFAGSIPDKNNPDSSSDSTKRLICDENVTFHLPLSPTNGAALFATITLEEMAFYEVTAYYLGNSTNSPPVGEYKLRQRPAEPDTPIVNAEVVRLDDVLKLGGFYQLVLYVYANNRQIIAECTAIVEWYPAEG